MVWLDSVTLESQFSTKCWLSSIDTNTDLLLEFIKANRQFSTETNSGLRQKGCVTVEPSHGDVSSPVPPLLAANGPGDKGSCPTDETSLVYRIQQLYEKSCLSKRETRWWGNFDGTSKNVYWWQRRATSCAFCRSTRQITALQASPVLQIAIHGKINRLQSCSRRIQWDFWIYSSAWTSSSKAQVENKVSCESP